MLSNPVKRLQWWAEENRGTLVAVGVAGVAGLVVGLAVSQVISKPKYGVTL